jgi:hypothetical protein
MTCYICDKCGRFKHISQLGEFTRRIKIGKLTFNETIWLCKWCLTKAGIKYTIDNYGFVKIERKKGK